MASNGLHELLRRDRQVVLAALAVVVVASWSYTVLGVGMDMSNKAMPDTGAPTVSVVGPGDPGTVTSGAVPSSTVSTDVNGTTRRSMAESALMLAMWWIMMIAMMLPSAAPTVLLAAAINRRARVARPPYGPTALFVVGYLLAWLGFSVVATAAHRLLEHTGLLDAMMRSSSEVLSGALLLAAGLWQYTPIKHVCLKHCRSPVRFLVEHRRPGRLGALRMGVRHGGYCLGCCWFLMLLLFVGGVMSVAWIGALALFVLVEKRWARGESFGRVSGALAMLSGAAVLLHALGT